MSREKSLAVAQRILEKAAHGGDPSITPMQLIKLVYIAQGYMLGMFGRPLLDEPVYAWQYGPVVPSVYQAVKNYRSNPVKIVEGAKPFPFSSDEERIIDLVADRYGKVSGIALSSATHKIGTPWKLTWDAHGKNAPISNDLIEAHYSNILKQPKHSAL